MKHITKIYVLCDPDTNEIRYVGKTTMRLCNRLAGHMQCNKKTHSGRWIKTLVDRGTKPIIKMIEEAGDNWAEREIYWIKFYKDSGCRLTNTSIGGDGHNGFFTSQETRNKISTALKGKKRPAWIIEKMLAASRGRIVSEETKRKLSEARRNQVITDETKAKISIANKGRTKPPRADEHCRKISEKAKGRVISPEGRATRSTSMKAYAATPDGKAKLLRANAIRYGRVN